MELTGRHSIVAPRDVVWQMLNDPDVLRRCIPGCESLEGSATEGFTARVYMAIGPVKATFTGKVHLSNIRAPESYTISGEGKGGIAGFASGGADVKLDEDASGMTTLQYSAKASVGGKLAQLGSRLVDATARKISNEFFATFVVLATQRAGSDATVEVDSKLLRSTSHRNTLFWVLGAGAITCAALIIFIG